MEGLLWLVAMVVLMVLAIRIGPGKRHRRPRWTSSSDIDPAILTNIAAAHHHNHHHHDVGHHIDVGGHHH